MKLHNDYEIGGPTIQLAVIEVFRQLEPAEAMS
jgi:hypothetical protein